MAKVGINGFGRIGRLVARVASGKDKACQIVAINDPFLDAENMEYLFVHDSTHGKYAGVVSTKTEGEDHFLIIDGHKIHVYQEREPAKIPWGKVGADYIIESTGVFSHC